MSDKQPHIFVATPMYGGVCTGHFTQSLLQMVNTLGSQNIAMTFCLTMNESLIQRARNALAFQFLKREDATHLMFIDADIKFDPSDIVHMVNADKGIICGLYPKKEINWPFVAKAVREGVPDNELKNFTGSFVVNLPDGQSSITTALNQPFPILNGGTGFMLIKREVLEDMAEHLPYYINDVSDLNGQLNQDKIIEYFPVFIEQESKRLLSEDFAFCTLARKRGHVIWAAPWAKLSHIGSYVFDGRPIPAP